MQILSNAKIVSATLEEEVTLDGGDPLNKFVVDLETSDGDRKNDLVMWLPKGGRAKPPMSGEVGDFELEEKKYGTKVKRHRAAQQGGGGPRGGGGYRPTAPEDAKRMSRSTALSAAVAHPKCAELDSDALLKVAAKFAAFIYGEAV